MTSDQVTTMLGLHNRNGRVLYPHKTIIGAIRGIRNPKRSAWDKTICQIPLKHGLKVQRCYVMVRISTRAIFCIDCIDFFRKQFLF